MTVTPEDIARKVRQASVDAHENGDSLVLTAIKAGLSTSDIPATLLLDHVYAAAQTPVESTSTVLK